MFRELKNEAKITVLLHTKSPLAIRSAQHKMLNPALPDMQCIKSRYRGKDTVIVPGSSLKGVIRSRYEKVVSLFGGSCCDIFNSNSPCNDGEKWKKMSYEEKKSYAYKDICPVCRLFGSQLIASRIYFADAYPVGDFVLGERTGVGINRITGAAQNSVRYDFEIVEEGSFQAEITLKNYELYQMALLMYVLKDLDEGYVSLGSASTRGYGRMEVQNLEVCLREYRKNVTGWKGALDAQEIWLGQKFHMEYDWGQTFFGEMKLAGLTIDDWLCICKEVGDLESKVRG